MKKLTAGIFATILGLTTVNAFAATAGTKVASTNYVDGAVAAANAYTDTKVSNVNTSLGDYVNKVDFGQFKTENTAAIATAKSEAISTAATDATNKAAAAKSEAITAAADAAAKLYETKEAAQAYETKINAKATYATKDEIKNMATSGQITELGTRVGTIEADYLKSAAIADMATTGDVATAKQAAIDAAALDATSKANAAEAAAIAAAATDAASKANTAKSEAISEAATAAAKLYETKTTVNELAGQVSAHETSITANINSIDALNTEVAKKANSADVNASLELKADKATTYTKTEVNEAIAAAKTEATYSDAEVRGLISDNANAISTLQTASATHATKTELDGVKATADAAKTLATANAEEITLLQNEDTRIEGVLNGKADASELSKYILIDNIEDEYPTTKPAQQ